MKDYAILREGEKVFFPKKIELSGKKKRILELLSNREMSLKEISKELKISEQLAYYRLKKLIEEGLVTKIERKYRAHNSYYITLGKENFKVNIISPKSFLKNFIKMGIFDGYIVIGNIDPHGEFSARAKDVHYASYITLMLGKFVDSYKRDLIMFDTEIISKNLLKENLIVIGGPVTNSVAYRLNTTLKIRFLQELNWQIFSEYSRKVYEEEYSAIVVLTNNPWNKNNKILWVAGRRNMATRLAIDFLNNIEEETDFYYIINGKDLDGDGKIDEIEILEYGKS